MLVSMDGNTNRVIQVFKCVFLELRALLLCVFFALNFYSVMAISAEPELEPAAAASESSSSLNAPESSGNEGCYTTEARACNSTPDDAGRVSNGVQPDTLASNPINFMTGNKIQPEVDFEMPGNTLSFRRLYNSSNSGTNIGLGWGWHHTYSVSMFDAGNGVREIVQSNGSRIGFYPDGTTEEGFTLARGIRPNHGYVVDDGERHRWHLPDGRTLTFNGSYLVRISWSDHRFVKLFYRARRLQTVTDQSGRVLTLNYSDNTRTRDNRLSSYTPYRFGEAPGHLAGLTLPDGRTINYDFDERHNLTRVRFSDGTSREYHYENETYRSHLTGLTDQLGVRFSSWKFDEHGRAISSEHANGVEAVSFNYPDAKSVIDGDLVETVLTNTQGQQSIYSWQRNQLTNAPQLLSSAGVRCSTCPQTGFDYVYDELGRLISATHNGRGATSIEDSRIYTYDTQGRIEKISRLNGENIEELIEGREYFDDELEPSSIFRPSVNLAGYWRVSTERDQAQRPIKITESGYAPVAESVSADSTLTSGVEYEAIERITRYRYNDKGLLVEIDGPRDDVSDITRLEYNALSELVAIVPASGLALRFIDFDALGRLTRYQNGTQREVILSRDENGRVIESQQGEFINRYAHDGIGRMISVSDTDGRTVSLTHDDAGRLVAVTDDLQRTQSLEYDDESRVRLRQRLARDGSILHSLERLFDDLGNHSRSVEKQWLNDAELVSKSTTYEVLGDDNGTQLSVTDADSGLGTLIQANTMNDLINTIDSAGAKTTLALDIYDRVASHTDARGNKTTHWRDDFGNPIVMANVDSGVSLLSYDAADNLVESVDAQGRTARYRFDAADRLIERVDEDGTTHWRWDQSTGGLAEVSDEHSTERFEYNVSGLLASHTRIIDGHRFETGYRYDARNRLTHTHLPDGQVLQHHYHTAGPNVGLLKEITRGRWGGLREQLLVGEIDLDSRDGESGYVGPSGLRTEHQYYSDGAIKRIEVGGLLTLDYQFDTSGRVVMMDQNGEPQRYQYAQGALVQAETVEGEYRFGVDEVGNRTFRQHLLSGELVGDERYAYTDEGQGNQLVERSDLRGAMTDRYTYSASGAPLTVGQLRYVYDAKDQPIELYRDEQLVARYSYNGFGERIRKVVYSTGKRPKVTYFLYASSTLVAEAAENGDVVTQYVYLEDHRPVLKLHGQDAYLIHTDHLGTPRLMSDEQGQVRWQANYTPFGQAIIKRADIDLSLRLPGQYVDEESGTHYNYRRNYDPATGRYLRSDPIGLGGGVNTYAYALAEPLGRSDPLGLQEQQLVGGFLENPSAEVRRIIQSNGLQPYVDLARTPAANELPAPPRPGVLVGTVLRSFARANALVSLVTTSYDLGFGGAALADALIFAPADQAELLAHIRRYDEGYELTGVAAQLNREGIWTLGNDLFQAQLAYLNEVSGLCVPDQQLYFDALWNLDRSGGLVVAQLTGIPQPLQPSDEDLLEPLYRIYQENGGALTFAQWQSEGMPVDDDAANSDDQVPDDSDPLEDQQETQREIQERAFRTYQANGGELSFDDWLAEGMPADDAGDTDRPEPPTWTGSGPVSGVLGVNENSTSVAAIQNYFPTQDGPVSQGGGQSTGIEFVFDPQTDTFVVGRPNVPIAGSGHEQLARSINADESQVLGGIFSRDADGNIVTNENSGHYWENWTPELRQQFTESMQRYGLEVLHENGIGSVD